MRFAISVCVLAFTLPLVSGCGDGLVQVRGNVTLDGRPVDEGSVSFAPASGNGPSGGTSVREGKFEVTPGLVPGMYKVTVRGSLKTGKRIPAGPPLPPGSMMDEMLSYPPNGQPPETQEIEVTAGMQPLSFDLKSAPAKK